MRTKSFRARKLATRIAVVGALAVVPLSALAVPAFAATNDAPAVIAVDRDDHGQGDHRWQPGDRDDHHHDWDHGQQGPGPYFPPQLPSTGSF
ncbi:hypothetical protein [Nocardia sp. NPDC051570]|uniref:hypothetical protein n=1 Tax=Nocardia sp. NPDC051570 TaxID=3364324 RepID=UPI0037B49EA1